MKLVRNAAPVGAWLFVVAAVSCLVACGSDGGGNGADGGADARTEAPTLPLSAVTIDSDGACRIDVDCAEYLHCFQGTCVFECSSDEDCQSGDTCSARRQCEAGAQDGVGTSANPATPEVVPGVGLTNRPQELVAVKPGEATIKLTVRTTSTVPGGVIGYTVETYSHATRAVQRPAQVFQARGTDRFEIVIPTGTADPSSQQPGALEVQVASSVGSFHTRLQPQPTPTGRYGGTATLPRFGQVGLPIDFELVTDPIDATLETASHVYLVLPVRPGSVFSPVAPGSAEAVRVELTLRDFDGKWVGRTRSLFDFPAASMLSRYGAGSVARGLRFELALDGPILTGTVRDTWDGIFDARTADGVRSAAALVFEAKLDMQRVAPARGLADLPEQAVQFTAPVPAQPALDVGTACVAPQFAVPEVMVAGTAMNCTGIADAAGFAAAAPAAQATCAVAVAESALGARNTTANLIAAFLRGDTSVTGSESFADFMTRCAAGIQGACRPSPAVLCGRALTASAIARQGAPDVTFAPLYDAFTRTTREAFLGRQLAAYQSDTDTRLEWLRSQDYPAVVTAAVRNLNEQLIRDWRVNVLDAHFGSVSGQFDGAGLTVLGRQTQGTAPVDARRLLLSEMTQSWRGAMDAMTVAARRWNDIYQDTASRAESTEFVASRAFDLYVLGGVVDQLNVASGSSYASASIAAGFATMLDELRRLALPFSALVFARDAEVVVSRSLDPLSSDDTLLGEIRDAATSEIERASASVAGILERAKQMAVDEQLLRDDLNNQVDASFDELVSLCGFPDGCRNTDRENPECWPRVKAGECGFGVEVENLGTATVPALTVKVVDYTSGSNISDAGEAILQVVQAADQLDGARSALSSYLSVTSQMSASYAAMEKQYKENVDLAEASSLEINRLFAEILKGQDDYDVDLQNWYDDLVEKRASALAERRTKSQTLTTLRTEGREQDIRFLRASSALRQGGDTLKAAADRADTLTEIFAESIPDGPSDLGAAFKGALKMTTKGITSGMDIASEVLATTATIIEVEREAAAQLSADKLAGAELSNSLDAEERANEIANFEDKIQLNKDLGDAWEARRRDLIEQLQIQLEQDRQIDRDYNALVERRDALFERIVSEKDREVQIHQSEFAAQQRQTAYLRIVQRAQLLDGRLRTLVAQRDQLNLNLGSPSVVFGWANQLGQAESRLERAKDKLMEWVVALEYLAVRPFMDARLQILLARNTYQLAEIANSLDDIQSRCGGAINTNSAQVSLRDDVLRLDTNLRDPVTGTELSPAETFREILARGQVPVDKRIRISADSTVGDPASRGGLLSVTFDLGLKDFSNLASSCNAKVQDLAVELVGQDLGKANPTVAIVYDGESTVRSCQPDIEDIVDDTGRDATAFAAVTVFKAAGRVLAPVAGVNEFGASNQTLVGLPLASAYTIIIDPTVGENASINWANLEDVRLKITYGYQDFFPAGQCY